MVSWPRQWKTSHSSPQRQGSRPRSPRFLLLAVVVFAAFALLQFASDSPHIEVFALPAFVFGCRYYELARFRAVHRSRWLLLCVLWYAVASVAMSFYSVSRGSQPLWIIVHAIVWLLLGCHLFVVQRRLRREQDRRDRPEPTQCNGPDWACGGLLAIFALFLVADFFARIGEWRSPWSLMAGFFAASLFVLQLQRHRLFPRLALAWLLVWLGEEALRYAGVLEGVKQGGRELTFQGVMVVLLGAYLLLAARVRRTFAAGTQVA